MTACPPLFDLVKGQVYQVFCWCGNPKAIPITIWITDSKVRARLAARRQSESVLHCVEGAATSDKLEVRWTCWGGGTPKDEALGSQIWSRK